MWSLFDWLLLSVGARCKNPAVADIFPLFIWNSTFVNDEDCVGAGVPDWNSLR